MSVLLLSHEQWLEGEVRFLNNRLRDIKNQLWEVQKKDVADIQFWKDRYQVAKDKTISDQVLIYNMAEKTRALQDPSYEPHYTSGWVKDNRPYLDYRQNYTEVRCTDPECEPGCFKVIPKD